QPRTQAEPTDGRGSRARLLRAPCRLLPKAEFGNDPGRLRRQHRRVLAHRGEAWIAGLPADVAHIDLLDHGGGFPVGPRAIVISPGHVAPGAPRIALDQLVAAEKAGHWGVRMALAERDQLGRVVGLAPVA